MTADENDCPKRFTNTSPMVLRYRGEEDPNNRHRWNYPNLVHYLDEADRKKFELDVNNGLLVNKETGGPFDTADAQTHWSGAIFVMDPDGRIYA